MNKKSNEFIYIPEKKSCDRKSDAKNNNKLHNKNDVKVEKSISFPDVFVQTDG